MKNFRKIVVEVMMLLVVYVSISFGNEVVILTISKTSLANTAGINLYLNDDTVPFTALETSLTQPWVMSAELGTINGVLRVRAVPFNGLGQEGTSSLEFSYAVLPDGSDIVIKIEKTIQ